MNKKAHCVILSGSGISEESGLQTFRGTGGLWEGHRLEEVASPEAWERDPELVLRFYNMRRQALRSVKPNAAHEALVDLEQNYRVSVVTQNVDDLHERAGSSNVLHLHGELRYARSSGDSGYRVHLGDRDISLGDCCPQGHQLRPDIVWFGEDVAAIRDALSVVATADSLIVVGTSLVVYPAASLIHFVPQRCRKWLVDPSIPPHIETSEWEVIPEKATVGLPKLVGKLIKEAVG